MQKCIFIQFTLLVITFQCYGQSITWQRTYDGPFHFNDAGYGLCNADNGNFYIVGSMQDSLADNIYVLKINQFGDTLWTRHYGDGLHGGEQGFCATTSSDFGCVISGYWDSSFTMKVSPAGDLVWQKFYGGSFVQVYDIQTLYDGSFVACGREVGNNIDGYVLKISSVGDLQWQKIFQSGFSKVYYAIVPHGNGYFLAGALNNYSTDTTRGLITHIDSIGNMLWEDTLRVLGLTSCVNIRNANASFIVGGITGYPFYENFFLKVDTSGIISFTKVFTTDKKEFFNCIRVISPNRYVIATGRDSLNGLIVNQKIYVIDSIGNVLHDKVYFTGNYIVVRSMLPLSNGDVVYAGTSRFDFNHYSDVYALRTDSLLNAPPPIGVIGHQTAIPNGFKLYQNFPNPFNPVTKIKFDLPKSAKFAIQIFDVTGKVIWEYNDTKPSGSYSVVFDGSNLASGLYLYKFEVDNYIITKKMVLLK